MRAAEAFHPLQNEMDWQEVLRRALSNGGDWAEIFWERSTQSVLEQQDGDLKECSLGTDEGIGLRVFSEGRTAYMFTNDFSPAGIQNLARQVAASVRFNKQDVFNSWKKEILSPTLPFTVKRSASHAPLKERIELLRRIESECRRDASVSKVRSVYGDSRRQIFVARSDGRHAFDDKESIRLIAFVAGQGPERNEEVYDQVGGYWGLEQFQEHSPEALAQKCVARLHKLFRAVAAPSGSLPVILGSEAGGTMIHEAVGHGLEADLAAQGLSVYANRIGQKVAHEKVTVIDDGTLAFRRGTHSIDDEGNPTQKTVLIENGILKNYMVDQKMSLRLGLPSTGNGRRQSYHFEPMVRMTNTFVAPGKDDPEKILQETPYGIYVADMGGGQVDPVSGNFVFSAPEAYLIRNGEKAEAIRGATLCGNGPRILEEIDRIGRDLGWANGTCGKNGQSAPVTDAQPTLRMPSIVVGGQVPVSTYFRSPS